MRHLAVLIWLTAIAGMPIRAAASEPLTIKVTCPPRDECTYKGQHYFRVDVTIENFSDKDVFLTTDFMKNAGPDATFTDVKTGKSTVAYAGLGDTTLLGKYERIAPRSKVSFKEAIRGSSVIAFGEAMIDVDVELVYFAKWKYRDSQSALLKERGRFKIRSADAAAKISKPAAE